MGPVGAESATMSAFLASTFLTINLNTHIRIASDNDGVGIRLTSPNRGTFQK